VSGALDGVVSAAAETPKVAQTEHDVGDKVVIGNQVRVEPKDANAQPDQRDRKNDELSYMSG